MNLKTRFSMWLAQGLLDSYKEGKYTWKGRIALWLAERESGIKMDELKSGWKTSEFWGTHLTQIVTFASTILALFKLNLTAQEQTAIVTLGGAIIGAVQIFYTKSRTDIKVAQIEQGK